MALARLGRAEGAVKKHRAGDVSRRVSNRRAGGNGWGVKEGIEGLTGGASSRKYRIEKRFGGIRKLTRVTDVIVPVMAVIYVLTVISLLLFNLDRIPWFFYSVFTEAFRPESSAAPSGRRSRRACGADS